MDEDEEVLVEKEVDRVILINTQSCLYGNKISRNSPCPCGSGKKYKNCCLEKDKERVFGKQFKVRRLVKERKKSIFKEKN